MPVAIIASLLGLVVVLIAYYRDTPLEERRLQAPDWELLPDPAEVARTEFPLAFPGYDPATVEFHFDLLTRAYADLLAVATPDVLSKARHRAAMRRGVDVPNTPTPDRQDAPAAAPASRDRAHQRSSLAPVAPDSDLDALRAEAALAELETRGPSSGDGRR